ncbi:MAG: glycosyltransferase family 2 protein [Candidatus Theseobacter exili]|nr:glycosyltransferase family 2 protein [Candidatus Theseobacter exili]
MKISIITPTFNSLSNLKQTHKSIADQQSAEFEHIIIDGNSEDRTHEWLKTNGNAIKDESKTNSSSFLYPSLDENIYDVTKSQKETFQYISEPDNGIYDALNKGFQHATGEIFAWLNSDEQYLPGTLKLVTDFFKKHPDVDILFGSMLMVDDNGELLAFRKAMPMRLFFLRASYLYNFSCAMFFRKELFQKLNGFNSDYKAGADMDFVYKAMMKKAKTRNTNHFLSTFIYNDKNLSSEEWATDEHEKLINELGIENKISRAFINLARLTEKFMQDGYKCQTPLNYSIHTDETDRRKDFSCSKVSAKWPGHKKPYILNHRNS